MSHLGLRILYALLNERPDVAAERVYAPWPDMEDLMRAKGLPAFFVGNEDAGSAILTWSVLPFNMK